MTTLVDYFTFAMVNGVDDENECKSFDENGTAPKAGGLLYIRVLVRQKRYVLSSKAYMLHSEGYFELEDLENSICCGSVAKTEKDERSESLGNKKYVIVGPDMHGYDFYSVGKIKRSGGGHTYYLITAHPMKRG